MASRIEPFAVTVPAGTPVASPIDYPTVFSSGLVERIDIIVPPGPSGLVGFQVVHSGQTVLPATGGTFFVADDHAFTWPLSGFPIGELWAVRAYNVDVYDHTLYVNYLVSEIPQPFSPGPELVQIG